jgi:di/tricarboxylate transporter
VISSALDVGWVYALAGAVCGMLKLADQRTVISKHIPWGIIILVSGFTILLSILTENGCADMIATAVTNNISSHAVAPLLGLLAGITSLFSDSIGVVLPLYIPICAGTLASGVSATAVFSSAIVGGLSTGCAPFSTGGAMVMSFAPEVLRKKMFWVMLGASAVNLVVVVLMSAIGIFG